MTLGTSVQCTRGDYTYTIRSAHYNLLCLNELSFDVNSYLAGDSFAGTSNIQGFLTYLEVEHNLTELEYNFMELGSNSFDKLATAFRNRSSYDEKACRKVFVTYIKQIPDEEYYVMIGDMIFLHIKCPPEGQAQHDGKIVTTRYDVEEVKPDVARCLNERYPEKVCPEEPIAVRLGELMPHPNDKEINLIGVDDNKTFIEGLLIESVTYKNKKYDALDCRYNNVKFDKSIKYLFDYLLINKDIENFIGEAY